MYFDLNLADQLYTIDHGRVCFKKKLKSNSENNLILRRAYLSEISQVANNILWYDYHSLRIMRLLWFFFFWSEWLYSCLLKKFFLKKNHDVMSSDWKIVPTLSGTHLIKNWLVDLKIFHKFFLSYLTSDDLVNEYLCNVWAL